MMHNRITNSLLAVATDRLNEYTDAGLHLSNVLHTRRVLDTIRSTSLHAWLLGEGDNLSTLAGGTTLSTWHREGGKPPSP
jgi:hypothetical protein